MSELSSTPEYGGFNILGAWYEVECVIDPRNWLRAASRLFVVWNMLGLLDLAVAVSIGAISASLGTGAAPMARMPLVLIPAYLVPLLVMLYLSALLQARRLRSARRSGEPAQESAAPDRGGITAFQERCNDENHANTTTGHVRRRRQDQFGSPIRLGRARPWLNGLLNPDTLQPSFARDI